MGTTRHPRISKREFISRVAVRSDLSIRVVSEVYKALLGELTDSVSGGETVVLTGFGRFYRQAHKGHKVRFGKQDVDDYSVLKFSASRSINRRLEVDERTDSTRPERCGMIEDTVGLDLKLEAVS
ncbi:HU family DNA-binding protein [Saccharopolyspora shandongensis]|uniref:HU family DNA-binding protein n=1 Tax=Saccharopolyspora shandongensis TaxID=418495 RepID=UPI0034003BAF